MVTHKDVCKLVGGVDDLINFVVGDCEFVLKYFDDISVVAIKCNSKANYTQIKRNGVDIATYLETITSRNNKLVLSGFSTGGAIALVVAATLSRRGYQVREWIGFGSPGIQKENENHYWFMQTNYTNGKNDNELDAFSELVDYYYHNYTVVDVKINDTHSIEKYYEAF